MLNTSSSSTSSVSAIKYINIKIVEARGLLPMDSNGLSDPFCVVYHNDNKKSAKSTEIIYKTLTPVWTNGDFTFKVVSPLTDTLKLVCWDFDKIGMNDFEGQVVIPVAAAKANEPTDMWVPLVNKKNVNDKSRGEVRVILNLVDPSNKSPRDMRQSSSPQLNGSDWTIKYSEITLVKELGKGAFGVVYKGKWRLQDCAVKVLPMERMGPKEMQEFQEEIRLMASLRPHRNLVTFLGVSMEPEKPVCLVTDFVDGGSLESKIADPSFEITWALILKLSRGICAGMHHLHEEGLLHRDLASRNILLTAAQEPVVSDFGLSKKVDPITRSSSKDAVVQETTFFRGPYKWMAPESIKLNVFSKKTDVWSYGVTLWEIMARSLPFPQLDIYTAADQISNLGLRNPINPSWPPKWQDILRSCWEIEPEKRPDFVQISQALDAIEQDMLQYSK